MAADSRDKAKCPGCGVLLSPQMRYCANCYRPTAIASHSRIHVETARQVDTTRRADPTVVFLPEAHEARLRRTRRRRRAAIVAAASVVVLGTASVAWMALGHRSREQHSYLARTEMARRELNSIADALERFRDDVGRYPTAAEGLGGLMRQPVALKPGEEGRLNRWYGPYLDTLPEVDPWGNDYVYETTGDGSRFRIFSHGPSGEDSAEPGFQVSGGS